MSCALSIVGYACSLGGPLTCAMDAPKVIQHSAYFANFQKIASRIYWQANIVPPVSSHQSKYEIIAEINTQLATTIFNLVQAGQFFLVLGGDHSCAIGTWSGASSAYQDQGALGLIWIDAHMDSHSQETSPSGNIHGMPVACLLGYGDPSLTKILTAQPKIKPEHLCLIGIRSFEKGEADLLKKLNVRIYEMTEIEQRGLDVVLKEAVQQVTKGTAAFGLSMDIDALDPKEAPGTGTREPNGIHAKELLASLPIIAKQETFIGFEIAEFDPSRDKDQITEKLVVDIMASLCSSKKISN